MIRTDKAPYPNVALTHAGMSGKNNEDRFAVSAYRLSSRDDTPVILAVLSDGIGGHRAGEIAAEIAVERISERVAESRGHHPTALLKQAVVEASEEIREMAQADPSRQGMGATCVAALVIGRRLYAVTVGDSRLYLMRGGAIRQLSTDHTWIREALDAGILQPEEANGHPNAHVIRRYLGSPKPPEVDHRLRMDAEETDLQAEDNQGMTLQNGDRILLCSDGLTDLVSDAEILETFQQQPLEEAGQALIDLANARGGHDNITLIAVQVPRKAPAAAGVPLARWLTVGCLSVLALAALFTAMVFGWGFLTGDITSPTETPTPAILLTDPLPVAPTPGLTRPPTITMEPAPPVLGPTITPTPRAPAGGAATLTPWPTNTLPIQ